MEIRSCAPDDFDRLLAAWPTPGNVAASHFAEQQATGASFLIAWESADPLGWAVVRWDGCVGPAARAAYPRCVEVIHLHVREAARGRGVGRALLGEAERLGRERGIEQIAVSVSTENENATRLYERLGYVATEVFDTCEYVWIDEAGREHSAVDSNELRVKRLRPT